MDKLPKQYDERLLVGFDSSDDAAVFKISEDVALIQTLDFFPSMVEDPYMFGQIAAANALSDVYAMGGEPITAMNIVAFPEEGDMTILADIMRGGAEKVKEAGCILAGGHSIDDPIPKYGLSVTGTVHPDNIIMNNTTCEGDMLIATKPLGNGIITTAYSVGETTKEVYNKSVRWMSELNKYAAEVMNRYPVSSATDITGFGLLGHLEEMLHQDISAVLFADQILYVDEAYHFASEFITTAGGQKNRNYLESKVRFNIDDYAMEEILLDPQTSGGLLMSIDAKYVDAMMKEFNEQGIAASVIGEVTARTDIAITVEENKNWRNKND